MPKGPQKSAPAVKRRTDIASRAPKKPRKALTMDVLRRLAGIPAAPRDRTPVPAIPAPLELTPELSGRVEALAKWSGESPQEVLGKALRQGTRIYRDRLRLQRDSESRPRPVPARKDGRLIVHDPSGTPVFSEDRKADRSCSFCSFGD